MLVREVKQWADLVLGVLLHCYLLDVNLAFLDRDSDRLGSSRKETKHGGGGAVMIAM